MKETERKQERKERKKEIGMKKEELIVTAVIGLFHVIGFVQDFFSPKLIHACLMSDIQWVGMVKLRILYV